MKTLFSLTLLAATLLATLAGPIYAVDGVVLINQSSAQAGNVTPGDTPGFPVSITVSGSYRLSSNLTLPDANTNGIMVSADNVTIDLNGFSIIGPVVCSGSPTVTSCSPQGSSYGILSTNPNTVVLNGDVHGMGLFGINLTFESRVENVHVSNIGLNGIVVAGGFGSKVSSCRVSHNAMDGIFASQGSTISGNIVNGNGGKGISAVCVSLIEGNTATSNAGGNISPFGSGCVLVNNAAP